MKLVSKYRIGPLFTPPSVSKADGPLGTIVSPGATGGTNWPGGSYDPETHTVYVFSQTAIAVLGLVPSRRVRSFRHGLRAGNRRNHAALGRPMGAPRSAATRRSRGRGDGQRLTVHGLPLLKPPYGRITAIDLDKGEIAWQVAHGETPDNIRNNPALKGLNIPRTGRPASSAC